MVDLKNEAAGVVGVVGFLSLVAVLAGLTTLLAVVLSGSAGLSPVAFITLTPLGAVLTAVGVGGLLLTWGAVASGYFEPASEPEPAVEDEDEPPEPPEPEPEQSSEADSPPDADVDLM